MTRKVLVLLSGGQDSTTSLYWAKSQLADESGAPEIHALSFSYGQRHHNELIAARDIAQIAGVKTHVALEIADVFSGSESALINHQATLTLDGGLKDQAMPQGLPSSFVPGRNLLFLAVAASRAAAIGADVIVTGVCQTDYSGYPDCREAFIDAMQDAITQAWPSGVPSPQILTPLMDKTKAQTVEMMAGFARSEFDPGIDQGSALAASKAWRALGRSRTCYNGNLPGCGVCAACVLRAKGFTDAGYVDPAQVSRY